MGLSAEVKGGSHRRQACRKLSTGGVPWKLEHFLPPLAECIVVLHTHLFPKLAALVIRVISKWKFYQACSSLQALHSEPRCCVCQLPSSRWPCHCNAYRSWEHADVNRSKINQYNCSPYCEHDFSLGFLEDILRGGTDFASSAAFKTMSSVGYAFIF